MSIITPQQSKGARAMLDMSRAELAAAAGIAERTLVDFERGARTPHVNNLMAIRRALEEAGVIFLQEGSDKGPGVRLKLHAMHDAGKGGTAFQDMLKPNEHGGNPYHFTISRKAILRALERVPGIIEKHSGGGMERRRRGESDTGGGRPSNLLTRKPRKGS